MTLEERAYALVEEAKATARIVIVGASLAGLRAAETLRDEVFTGSLTIIGDEPHEPYDPELGKWRLIHSDRETGRLVEERWLLPDGSARSPYLERQVRARDPVTRAIISVEPTVRVPRRRSRSVRG